MSRNRFELIGMRELQQTINEIGVLPQKIVTKSARSGMRIALNSAKQHAPVDLGNLKRGLILKGERMTVRGKKVFQVTIDPSMNDIFVKIHKAGENHSSIRRYSKKLKYKLRLRTTRTGTEVRSYYPASQEYGFFTRNGRYIPGFRYLRKAIDNNKNAIEQKMIGVFTQEFDKLR